MLPSLKIKNYRAFWELGVVWGLGWLIISGVLVAQGAEPPQTSATAGKAAEGGVRLRPYDDGLLATSDFRGEMPANLQPMVSTLKAMVFTELRYDFQYTWKSVGAKGVAKPTKIHVWAAMDREKSWWKDKEGANAALLDHEQGHFDVDQSHALRLQLELQKLIAAGKLVETAKDETAAKDSLKKYFQRLIEQEAALSKQDNQEYDQITNHGIDTIKQAEVRRVQKLELEKSQQAVQEKKGK